MSQPACRLAFHHRPFMNFELVWQRDEIARFHGFARLRQPFALPGRQILFIETFVLDRVTVCVGHRDDFAGFRVEVRGPLAVGKIHRVDNVSERNNDSHGQKRSVSR